MPTHLEHLQDFEILLASQSPRRQQLLKELGLDYKIKLKEGIEENYPENLKRQEVALFLAEHKASAYEADLQEKQIIITADTIVCLADEVLNKPKDRDNAIEMLEKLSGNKHTVITGVCLKSKNKTVSFTAETNVFFKELTKEEIEYYLDTYKPYDKAGAYGIQEWIGFIGIEKISGSYFNVVGLPVQKLYEELTKHRF